SPAVGNAWWDSVGGQLYLWFNDGTSAQWVPASNQPGPPGTSIPLPVAIASGGTNATTAAAALTNLGAVAKAGDTMTGSLGIGAAPAVVLEIKGPLGNPPTTGTTPTGIMRVTNTIDPGSAQMGIR